MAIETSSIFGLEWKNYIRELVPQITASCRRFQLPAKFIAAVRLSLFPPVKIIALFYFLLVLLGPSCFFALVFVLIFNFFGCTYDKLILEKSNHLKFK